LNQPQNLSGLVEDVIVGAMGAQNAMKYFKGGVLLITPGDREDIVQAACANLEAKNGQKMAGIILTGNLRPGHELLKVIREMTIPVLFTDQDSYHVASEVHDLTVKTLPGDGEKISLIRDLISRNVNVRKILESL